VAMNTCSAAQIFVHRLPSHVLYRNCRQRPIRALTVERPPGHTAEHCPRSRSLLGGIRPLRQYKLTFLDKLDFIVTVQDFESANDITALAHAYTLCGMHMIEVTDAGRRVGEITKGGPVSASGA